MTTFPIKTVRAATVFALGLVLTSHCPVAQAVMVEPDGRGQVLLFPYYSVNDGQQTLLTLVNHTNTGKAVKVRFRERQNGRATLSMNIYLSEFDVWTAAVIRTPGQDAAALITFDTTCTLPAIRANATLPQLPGGVRYLPFNTTDFSGVRADGGDTDANRTRDGYIEVIEMATLANNSNSDVAATHVGGVPRDCPALVSAWNAGGYWHTDSTVDLLPPSGQLSGTASVVALGEGTVFNVDPTALSGFSIVAQHTGPESALPDLASAITDPARLVVESSVLADGVLFRSQWPQARAVDAVSAVLARHSLISEFNIDTAIAGESEWVITLPTRRHYTDPALAGPLALPPFTGELQSARLPGCERGSIQVFDREGRTPTDLADAGDALPCLCEATQRLRVTTADGAGAAGAACMAYPLSTRASPDLAFSAGYFRFALAGNGHQSRPAAGGERYDGLPVIGFMRTSYQSRDPRSGLMRVYSSTTPHSGTVQCSQAAGTCGVGSGP